MPARVILAFALLTPSLLPAQACQPAPELAVDTINLLRAQGRRCGEASLHAVPPLRWNAALAESARHYAQELARRDRIDHVGESARSLRLRLREVGYVMKLAGENLAGGPENLDEALAQWLASPTHCENLMLPEFEEVGLACVEAPGRFQRYWVMHLAQPVRQGFLQPLIVRTQAEVTPRNAPTRAASAKTDTGMKLNAKPRPREAGAAT